MKRFCKNYLYYHLFADIFIALLFVLAFSDSALIESEDGMILGAKSTAVLILGIIAVATYIILILYRVLYLRTSGYALSENEIRVRRGVFFRKNSVLEYRRMHAIAKKQNIIQRLFGLAVLAIDSGSANTSGRAEILIYEASAEVDALLLLLKARKNGEAAPAEKREENSVLEERGDLVFPSAKKMA
jgi:uncharacterized membrane protein YdbT with pleckstrin-like domain